MHTKLKFILFIIIGLFFLQCERDFSVPAIESPVRELSPLEKRLVDKDNDFGLKLFKEIVKAEPDKNIFISPLSVAMALGMTFNGAANSTEDAMRNTLEFDDMSFQEINESFKSLIELLSQLDPKVQFDIANSIWYRLGFEVEQNFVDLNKNYFDAEVRGLDFSSAGAPAVINGWVDENTDGKIREIIKQIHPLTVMFLINAIYFNGSWTYEFDQSLTTDDVFTSTNGSQVPCKMMKQVNDFRYLETDDFQAVDLPYGDGTFSMTIFLPKPQNEPAMYPPNPQKWVDNLVEKFTPENWTQWIGNFSKSSGSLQFPKYELKYEIKLNDVLTALGMGIAFTDQADFTKINKNGGLFISQVKHKTFVKVDEEGTEAAAVTVVEMRLTSVGDSVDFVMRVDRPFVFVIRENHSQTILFMGKIVEPGM